MIYAIQKFGLFKPFLLAIILYAKKEKIAVVKNIKIYGFLMQKKLIIIQKSLTILRGKNINFEKSKIIINKIFFI